MERYDLVKNHHLTTLFGEGRNSKLFAEWKKGSSEDVSSYVSKKAIESCMLRLLWDGEKPVLFRERLYPDGTSSDYAKALNGLALKRSQLLGVPLTSLDSEWLAILQK